ncbi:septum formation family protein [Actinoplanes sp. NEAU-A12]|uniref:Septum formation family protein n=1 Tax=Actinoplanes sandaracinus TaxID=3045177 RepID=A0ABT6WZ73_9ACTN|nr:septum formation family protein [Actinoplanes sandaracinus]MDI6105024.1 septum formation family protein [Actinoplanes sandaracinus]
MRFRLRTRWGVTATTAALFAVAGCGGGGEVDGDLTNDWGAMAPATGFVPVAGTCHLSTFAVAGPRSTYEEADCGVPHRTETVFVGEYTAPAADGAEPPAGTSAGARAAYQTCDKKTTEYVGGPWRHARLWIGVTHPSPAAWDGGSRWFRCELVELDSVEDDGALVQRAGTLRGVLAAPGSELALTCYAIELDDAGAITTMPSTGCDQKHNGEFVGVWDAPAKASYPKGDAAWEEFHTGCRTVAAKYAGVPVDGDLQYRIGVVSLPGNADVWAQGDHGVRCYLWLDGAELTGSLKGKGTKDLPVQYK